MYIKRSFKLKDPKIGAELQEMQNIQEDVDRIIREQVRKDAIQVEKDFLNMDAIDIDAIDIDAKTIKERKEPNEG